ncbi:MAG: abortive infection family protein [Candidatus Melainabacteria bacterium]|jgi:hypothetical protein
MNSLPLEEEIIYSLSELFNDRGQKQPSHAEIKNVIERGGLSYPETSEGKSKKIQTVLFQAYENERYKEGGNISLSLCKLLKAKGGFIKETKNYVGDDPIASFRSILRQYNFILSSDGYITPVALEGLEGRELTEVLLKYAKRAQKGIEDAALVVGTGKDLIEATAKHVLVELGNSYSEHKNFEFLLAQCFMALGMKTSEDKSDANERKTHEIERHLFSLALSINRLRNKEGIGHGRPFISELVEDESKIVIELVGVITEKILLQLKKQKNFQI